MFGACLNIILNSIFIDMYGFIAAGYTTLVCYTIFAIAHYIYMILLVKKKEKIIIIKPIKIGVLSVGLIIITICMNNLYDYILLRYILIIVICLVLYIKRNNIIRLIKRG